MLEDEGEAAGAELSLPPSPTAGARAAAQDAFEAVPGYKVLVPGLCPWDNIHVVHRCDYIWREQVWKEYLGTLSIER